MPIQIQTQPAVIGWDVQKAQLDQSGNGINVLDLTIEKPLLEMRTELPKIQIDQSQSFADAGLKNLKAMMDESVSYGRQMVSQGVARIVDQGNRFIEIQTGIDPIPDQAIYNAYEMFEKDFNYGAIPQTRPNISLKEGNVYTTFNPGKVNNQSTPRKVDMQYTPWQVSYHMKQYNSISFSMAESKFKFTV